MIAIPPSRGRWLLLEDRLKSHLRARLKRTAKGRDDCAFVVDGSSADDAEILSLLEEITQLSGEISAEEMSNSFSHRYSEAILNYRYGPKKQSAAAWAKQLLDHLNAKHR